MDNRTNKNTAVYLLLGVVLMIVTMVLHPTGGDFERLIANSSMAMISHSLAIFSIPFSGLGFLGLTRILGKAPFFSRLALAVMLTGLFAAMLAAALNGLAQPIFAARYRDSSPETLEAIAPIFHYNTALNHAFDYILISAIFIAALLWSVAIIRTKVLPAWTGYLGILLVASAIFAIASGFHFLDLQGFRIFIFGWVLWIFLVAVYVARVRPESPD